MTVIRHLSDLHGSFPEPTQEFDLTVLSGDIFPDFLGYGNQHSAQEQEHWIKRHKQRLIDFGRDKPVYYVHGNHDFLNFDSPRRELGWKNLNNEYNEYYGILMYGFPYIPYICGRWNLELNDSAMNLAVHEMHKKFILGGYPHILVLHSPIHGILDSSSNWDKDSGIPNNHYGNVRLSNMLSYNFLEIPKIVLFGHIHESYGVKYEEINGCGVICSNAATTQNYITYDDET